MGDIAEQNPVPDLHSHRKRARGRGRPVVAGHRGKAGQRNLTGSVSSFGSSGSKWSIGSSGSILSIGSSGSILSIGSSGSILSIGCASSIASFGSVLSAGSVFSLLSAGSVLSVLSYRKVLSLGALPRCAGRGGGRGNRVEQPALGAGLSRSGRSRAASGRHRVQQPPGDADPDGGQHGRRQRVGVQTVRGRQQVDLQL